MEMKIIGTGIDIVSVQRLEEKIKNNPALEEKLFTPDEIAYCRDKVNYAENMAGRFAAKEAIYKVMSPYIPGLYFKDIEITSNGNKPEITQNCSIYKFLKENGYGYSISISHEREHAVASAIFWEEK
jgi:phosphopantetheine--protein transferase-like protein